MTDKERDRIECAIRHIQTAVDVDPWAVEIAVAAMKAQLSREDTTSDCISRQAAIKALGAEPEVWSGNDEYAQGLNNQWHYDVNALKAVPPAQPEREYTMEEFMYGQDMGNSEDGSL